MLQALVPRLRSLVGTDIELRIELPGTPIRVYADPEQVTEVVEELVKNAAAASRPGGVVVVSVATDGEIAADTQMILRADHPCTAFCVSDAGHGMDADTLGRMFDPFFSTAPLYAATGLGLAAVYGIVAVHQGGIAVRSVPGHGTSVWVFIPQSRPAPVRPESPERLART